MSNATVAKRDEAARIAMTAGLIACSAEVLVSLPLFFVHVPEIRPMMWAAETLFIVMVSALIGLPYFVWAMWGSRRWLAALGLLLTLAPLPLSLGLLRMASRICGFTLED